MGTVIVECDACHTKNRMQEDRIGTARCGKCGNPLMDAYTDQFGGSEEDEELEFDDDDDADSEDDEDDPRCFGCGHDWKSNWSEDDLATVKIKGVSKGIKTVQVCPECMDEVKQQYKVVE
jgi:hypothetical protein